MKKLLALALAVMLTLSMGVMAFAASSDNEREDVTLYKKPAGDTYAGLAAPNKNAKIAIEIIEFGDDVDDLLADLLKKEAALKAEIATPTVHTAGAGVNDTCKFCTDYLAAKAAYDNAEPDKIILDSVSAWKAYDTDKSFKISFKATKGADYIKSYEIKKNTDGEMYVQVNFNEYYLAGMKDIAWEITLTVNNADKFNKKCNETPTAGEFKRSQYVKFETTNYRYGFNGSNLVSTGTPSFNYKYKDYEIKDGFPTDYDIVANIDNDNGTAGYTSDPNSAIHYKKGTGETYSFDYGNGNAYFEVKMDNQAVVNLYLSTAAIKALVSAYPNAEMLFWDWKGKPDFDFTATVELSYDEDDVGTSPYLYKWDGSVLTEVSNAEFDDETCTFKTRSLGAYVMSDIELDAAAVAPATTADPADATEAPDDVTATTKTQNPDTGASDFVGVAVALAVVSLAAAGAVALKK